MGLAASQEQATTPVRGMFEAARQTFDDARVRQLFASKQYVEAKNLSLALLARKECLGKSSPSWQQSAETLLEIYYVTGDYERGVKLVADLLATTDETSRHHLTRLSKLAGLHEKMGAYEAAEPIYLKVLNLRKTALGDDHPDVMSSLSYLAALYRKMGAFEKAEQHLIDAKRILDKSQNWPRNREPDNENWSVSMGMLQHAMGRYDEAERLLKDVLKKQEPHQDKGERPQRFFATTVSLYASTCTALGDYEKAKTYFLKALELRKALFGPMHPHVAASLYELGQLGMACEDFVAAQEAYRESADIRAETLGETHPLYADSLAALAECCCYQSCRGGKETDEGYLRALELLLQVGQIRMKTISTVLSTVSESRRFAYLRTVENSLHLMISLVLGPLCSLPLARRAAMDAVLRWKGITFDAQVAEEQDDKLALLRSKLARLILDGASREQVQDCELAIEQLEASVGRSMDLQKRLESSSTDDVVAVLPASCELLEFLLLRRTDFAKPTLAPREDCYVAILAGSVGTDVKLWSCGHIDVINAQIAEFRELAKRPMMPNTTGSRKTFDSVGHDLLEALLGPFRGRCLKHLFLAADGELVCLPFASLPFWDGGFLVDAPWTFSCLFSGRDLITLHQGSISSSQPVVVAGPDFAMGKGEVMGLSESKSAGEPSKDWDRDIKFEALDAAREEGIFVHELLGGSLHLGENATVTMFKTIESPRILHVATHGFFLKDQAVAASGSPSRLETVLSKTENPYLRSGLALAGAKSWQEGYEMPKSLGSGIITAQEIMDMKLEGTQLAVLSACDTGLGEICRGQGVLGLPRAFLIAGARTVLMSLWQVNDKSTCEFMRAFHGHIKNGMVPVDALRAAMHDLRPSGECTGLNGRRSPSAWAAFTLQGWPF